MYGDDGLAAVKGTPRQTEKVKKEICSIFNQNKLKITIEANRKCVNFLDVTLDLRTGIYSPYMKPNEIPIYVHKHSNHPPSIIKNIPASINQRLSIISSNEKVFNKSAHIYNDVLKRSGYDVKLKYDENASKKVQKRRRLRHVTWFNPPFSKNVETNIGEQNSSHL